MKRLLGKITEQFSGFMPESKRYKIDGKWFYLTKLFHHTHKAAADKYANMHRSKGRNARVIKFPAYDPVRGGMHGGSYGVYVHPKP